MEKIKIIMDVDPGIDDAIAMCFAFGSEKFDILGFTTVFGNRSVDVTTENALRILELIGRTDVPVAKGAGRPIVKPYNMPKKSIVHGEDGLGDMENPLPAPTTKALDISAVEFMAQTIRNSEEPITLVPVGPLTNIATFIMTHPELLPKVKEIVLMGGSTMRGCISPVAEANVGNDPEAAHIVFSSGVKIRMAGLDATWKGYISFDELEEFRKVNWLTEIFYQMSGIYAEHYKLRMKEKGLAMHDSLPLAWLIDPSIVTSKDYYVKVDINGRYTYGMTVTDVNNVMGEKPNATVAMDVDRGRFIRMLVDGLETVANKKSK